MIAPRSPLAFIVKRSGRIDISYTSIRSVSFTGHLSLENHHFPWSTSSILHLELGKIAELGARIVDAIESLQGISAHPSYVMWLRPWDFKVRYRIDPTGFTIHEDRLDVPITSEDLYIHSVFSVSFRNRVILAVEVQRRRLRDFVAMVRSDPDRFPIDMYHEVVSRYSLSLIFVKQLLSTWNTGMKHRPAQTSEDVAGAW
jgi:hypothetical protein